MLRWKQFDVLDHGYVCLVDVMGDDRAICDAARISYGAGTRAVSDDRTLIRYLMRHRHTSPFEMAELKFCVRCPMDTWRQWIRQRMASANEYSTRYSEAIDAAQATSPAAWRGQSSGNRQGSGGFLDPAIGEALTRSEADLQRRGREVYEERLRRGVAREQARKDLPLSTYTEAYWKIDLHNLLHFLSLRMGADAQEEIRAYAEIIGREIVAPLFPLTWEAFEDYRLKAISLTAPDITAVRRLMAGEWLDRALDHIANRRERDECAAKLARLGLIPDAAPGAGEAGELPPRPAPIRWEGKGDG